jgi:hypothetical protein
VTGQYVVFCLACTESVRFPTNLCAVGVNINPCLLGDVAPKVIAEKEKCVAVPPSADEEEEVTNFLLLCAACQSET